MEKLEKEKFDVETKFSLMYKLQDAAKINNKEDLLNMARVLYDNIFKDIIDTQNEFSLFIRVMRLYMIETETDKNVSQEDLSTIQQYMVRFASLGKCELNDTILPTIIRNLV